MLAAFALALIATGFLGSREGGARPSTAPGAPGDPSSWTTGAKQGIGTSTTVESKVWYTLAQGVMTEVYYPTVDVANTQDMQFIVSDGRTFSELERDATTHKIELVDPNALTYRQVNTDKDGRYRITKTYVTDPKRSTLLMNVRFESLDGGDYGLYVLYNPSINNTGKGDAATNRGDALVASEEDISSALVSSAGFSKRSNGYAGASDGWTDLKDDYTMDWTYASAPDGNVVQTAQIPPGPEKSREFTLALGFGKSPDAAVQNARTSLQPAFRSVEVRYRNGWRKYVRSLDPAPRSVAAAELKTQYNVAVMTLKAHEDKTYRGANIASLTIPWGQAINADNAGVGGYHLVWARDLYQEATAMLAAGDRAAAERSLDYLFEVQQKPDGSFPQNSYLDGTPYWGGLQLDEVAFPIVLAWQLGRDDANTYRDHVKKAADFIVDNGPSTPQERWEEEGGYSPSTIAAEIAGLVAAADIAEKNGDQASTALYTGVADEWQRKVEDWTFTTTGPLGDGEYYERIDQNGDPNDGQPLEINNGGGTYDERSIVDAGFLELVRLGVKPPNDPYVARSLPEVDSTIKVETPNGPVWYRYNHDGYGEKADGSPYDGTGIGRLWPLLTGERGEYELANGRTAGTYLRTMAGAANEGYMIPEQVWDRPEPTSYGFEFGEGTGSATPLAWSMAQFVRLARSIDAGRPVETPSVVADRYAGGSLLAGPELTVTEPQDGSTTDRRTITVSGTTGAAEVYVKAGGEVVEAPVEGGRFSTEVSLRLGENQITVVAVGDNGGTTTRQFTVTSTNFGQRIGGLNDPTGDDNGPGSYVYPTNGAFNEGAFDLTGFAVYDDGNNYNFVAGIAGDVRNPWGGDQISVQRLNFYVQTRPAAGGAVPALPGTNAKMAEPYQYVVIGDGFNELGVKDASGKQVSGASLLAVSATNQIAVSVPKSAFGGADLSAAGYSVVMLSHAGSDEGIGYVRPVYDYDYWNRSPEFGMGWIKEYRFGGGAGEYDGSIPGKDTDTRDPNVIDVIVRSGQNQGGVLDYTAESPVTLPYVELGQ